MNFILFIFIFIQIHSIQFVHSSINFAFPFSDDETNQIANLNFADEMLTANHRELDFLQVPLAKALSRKEIPLFEYNRRMEMLTNYRKLSEKAKVKDLKVGDQHLSIGFTGDFRYRELFDKSWEKFAKFNDDEKPIKPLAKFMGELHKVMPSVYKMKDENGQPLKRMPRKNHLVATADQLYSIGFGGGKPTSVDKLEGNLHLEGYDTQIFRRLLEEQGFGQAELPRLTRAELHQKISSVMDKYFFETKGLNANYVSRSGIGTIHIPGQEPIRIAYKPEMDWKTKRLIEKANWSPKERAAGLNEAILSLHEAGVDAHFGEELKAQIFTNYNKGGSFKRRMDQLFERQFGHQQNMEAQMRTGLRRTNSASGKMPNTLLRNSNGNGQMPRNARPKPPPNRPSLTRRSIGRNKFRRINSL